MSKDVSGCLEVGNRHKEDQEGGVTQEQEAFGGGIDMFIILIVEWLHKHIHEPFILRQLFLN